MSLPKYLPLLAFALLWVWLRLRRADEQLRRIEMSTGTWRVQAPYGLKFEREMSADEVDRFAAIWRRELFGEDAA